jgi:hypothetical protein
MAWFYVRRQYPGGHVKIDTKEDSEEWLSEILQKRVDELRLCCHISRDQAKLLEPQFDVEHCRTGAWIFLGC